MPLLVDFQFLTPLNDNDFYQSHFIISFSLFLSPAGSNLGLQHSTLNIFFVSLVRLSFHSFCLSISIHPSIYPSICVSLCLYFQPDIVGNDLLIRLFSYSFFSPNCENRSLSMDARCCASVCARSFGIFVYRFVLADGGGCCCCCCCCWLLCHRCFPCQTFTTAYRHRDIKLNISVVGSVR